MSVELAGLAGKTKRGLLVLAVAWALDVTRQSIPVARLSGVAGPVGQLAV